MALSHGSQLIAGAVGLGTLFLGILAIRDSDKTALLEGLGGVRTEIATLNANVKQLQSFSLIAAELVSRITEIGTRQKMNEDRLRTLEDHDREQEKRLK